MCLIAFSWQPENGRLLLLANRDEFYERPTAHAQWWTDYSDIWAGRDLQAGGTWLGVNRAGRFAALTNIREGEVTLGKRSRGELVSGFLSSNISGADYLKQVLRQGSDYAGFNLLVGDISQRELWYGANRAGGEARLLPLGHYGLSNGLLDAPWPKVQRLKQGLIDIPKGGALADIEPAALQLLSDNQPAPVEQLPNTGVAPELERLLSAPFIHCPHLNYGTRAQTVLCIHPSGIDQHKLEVMERTRGADGTVLATNSTDFIKAAEHILR
ncbi:NRDE family protein [Oceanisphaera pacifica]|uniref:NRDE family protein n=1 Tax=Oceanisphaera pacifica TaxID=2818389 RepID=A0ABS3NDM2_9GAMM|nr:NRDE family protein [Oceanisphaera pacifica]MBO1518577.1 NRDE family protein [Oceanisphaera pacifica]